MASERDAPTRARSLAGLAALFLVTGLVAVGGARLLLRFRLDSAWLVLGDGLVGVVLG